MDKARIKKIILDKAGNPSSGPIKDLADTWAEAIADEISGKKDAKISRVESSDKETRVIGISETR